MTSRAIAAAVAFAAALSITSQARAADAWAPLAQFPGAQTEPAGVAIAPDGTVTTATIGKIDHRVEIRTKPPGGTFGPPQTLTTSAESGVRMRADRAGNLAVVWTQKIAGVRALRGTTRPAGGAFGPVRVISDSGSDADWWDLEVAGGKVLVSWVQNQRLRVASATPGSAFEVADPLTGPISNIWAPDAALAPNGAAVIVWSVPVLNGGRRIQAAARPAGGAFAPLPDLGQVPTSTYGIGFEHVSISDEGRATAAWTFHDNAAHRWVVQSASRGTTGSFGGVESVDTADYENDGTFGLATSPGGSSLLVWADGISTKLRYAIRPEGSGFGATQTVAGAAARAQPPVIRFGSDDVAHVVWQSDYQGMQSVQAARVNVDGTSSPAENIGIPSVQPGIISVFVDPSLAIDPAGNAVLAWTRGTDTDPGPAITYDWAHELRVFDTKPPAITAIDVPASALTGVPVPMSVSAADSLTPVTVRWKMNKFTTLSGPSIASSYTSPGTYGVSIEVADASGHTVSAARSIQIAQNPVPPCPERQICE